MHATVSDPGIDRRSWVWGLPLVPWTRAQAADAAMALVEAGGPSYFITANAHYAMLTERDAALRAINDQAAFILADGAPLVWASRYGAAPLPERVAGSDLIYDLCRRAAERGFGVFLMGGAPGVAEQAGRRLEDLHPGLRIVGVECPPFGEPSAEEILATEAKISSARPDILILASTMPKGELWISAQAARLGIPLCVNLGAAMDFVAGRVPRAPRLVQRIGMEWAYRMWREPSRLAPRYARNAAFILKMLTRDARHALARSAPRPGGVR
jgi:N-acetylglucosaminyldiphosphoundecaprenol N-acetyl-beta-D-mannosaminyltransferase